MKTCVVTGGAGFIGSHLCDRLLVDGFAVVAVDNLITGNMDNLVDAKKHEAFRFIQSDVIEPGIAIDQVDYIFHLASPASPKGYQTYPKETALVNSVGTMNMLDLAVQNSARLLYTSTSEVYGDPLEHPQKESYWGNVNPVGPRACYDESKRFGEMMCTVYRQTKGLDVRIVRIFNTYGPRLDRDDGRVMSNFITQALAGEALTIYGDGEQTRSFCYVTDLVEGIVSLMFGDGLRGEIVNLGNPDEYTMLSLAETVKRVLHADVDIEYKPRPQDDPSQRRPDITKAKELLSWQPAIGLEEGILSTANYYRDRR